MPKQSWMREKELPNLESYEEAIIIMMRYGGSIENIAIKLKVPYEYLLGFLNNKGIITQLKNRSWTYKGKPKRKSRSTNKR
jgi:hypothetical protein